MSRSTPMLMLSDPSFPRVSGDEPFQGYFREAFSGFSPRERG